MAMNSLIPWRRNRNIALRRSDEGSPLLSLQREMNRMFDDFFGDMSLGRFGGGEFMPRVNVSEDEKEITVEAELPGMSEKDIDVRLEGNLLTLSGEKKQEHEEKKKGYHYTERSFGSFTRTIELPGEADPEKVQAAFKDGVLKIQVPRPDGAKSTAKKIDVRAG